MYEKEEDEEDEEEVKKAYNEVVGKLKTILDERFVKSAPRHPGLEEGTFEKQVSPFESDLAKSVAAAPHFDKIQHIDSYYNVNYQDEDLEFMERIEKASNLTAFKPGVLNMSLPTNDL